MSLLIVLLVLAACAAATIHLGRGLRPITIAAGLLLAGFVLMLPIGLDPAIVVDRGRLWLFTVLFAVPVVVALGAWWRLGAAARSTPLVKLLIVGAAGSLLSGLALVRAGNMVFDAGPATAHAARVALLESVGNRRGRTWHVELGETGLPNVRRLRIDEDQYARLRVGMPVNVSVHPGAFGIRWVRDIAQAP